MRTSIRLFGLAALIAATVSCGDVVRQGSSPVFLVIDQLAGQRGGGLARRAQQPVELRRDHQHHVAGAVLDDFAVPDDLRRQRHGHAAGAAQGYRRHSAAHADLEQRGHDQPDSRAVHAGRRPQHARGSTCRSDSTARLPARSRQAGSLQLGFELVRNVAKQESPLVQLRTSHNFISAHRHGDVLRRRPRRQQHPDDRADPDRVRQFWGSVGPCLSHIFAGRRWRSPCSDAAGCTVKNTEAPPLTGPSGLALTLNVNAVPDTINQDGGSQSSVRVTAIGPDGKGIAALPLRLDMVVGGVAQDYGTLSARSVVTNSDGVAIAVYTAPPRPANGVFGTCSGVPGNCVTDRRHRNVDQFRDREPRTGHHSPGPDRCDSATGRRADRGVHHHTDAGQLQRPCRSSTPRPACQGRARPRSSATPGTFGDGSSGTGKTVSHTYTQSTSPGNTYNVTLTVTNDRGLGNSTTQAVSVDALARADRRLGVLADHAERRAKRCSSTPAT